MRLADTTSGAQAAVNRYLLPTERDLITVRQHPAVLAGPILTALAGLAAAAIVTPIISAGHQALVGFVWTAWGLLLLRAIFKVMSWSADYFAVTSERILMLTGIFNRRVAIIPFLLVNDFSFRRSVTGRFLGYGEFVVRYGARDEVLQRIQYIPYPEQLSTEIYGLLHPPDEEAAEDERET